MFYDIGHKLPYHDLDLIFLVEATLRNIRMFKFFLIFSFAGQHEIVFRRLPRKLAENRVADCPVPRLFAERLGGDQI
jgi:hypothetical protein